MKAISLTQPWATLVAIGAKRIETRSWGTNYRGPLAIHASKGFPRLAQELCVQAPFGSALSKAGYTHMFDKQSRELWPDLKPLPLGAIVATCELLDCIVISTKREVHGYIISMGYNVVIPPDVPELCFGDYAPGRLAWILANVKPLPEPIPAKGALGMWEWQQPDPAAVKGEA